MLTKTQTPPSRRDAYWAASAEERREYDAFGPWTFEIRTPEDMPPRFRAAWPEHAEARYLLKVPVKADRVDMRPGMDLYDIVIAVHDDRLAVLRRLDDGVVTRTIGWADIAAIRSFADLLDGHWSLLLSDGETLAVTYNAVSTTLFDTISRFVRDRLAPARPDPGAPDAEPKDVGDDLFYLNQMKQVQAETAQPVRPIHFEQRGRFCRDGGLRYGLSNGLLVLDAGDHLVIIDRGAPIRQLFRACYAVRRTLLPYARIDGFAFLAPRSERRSSFGRLDLVLGRQTIGLRCLDAPDALTARLAAKGVRQLTP